MKLMGRLMLRDFFGIPFLVRQTVQALWDGKDSGRWVELAGPYQQPCDIGRKGTNFGFDNQ